MPGSQLGRQVGPQAGKLVWARAAMHTLRFWLDRWVGLYVDTPACSDTWVLDRQDGGLVGFHIS